MEKDIKEQLPSLLDRTFDLEKRELSEYSPLALAYIGDGVYDLVIKTIVVRRGGRQVEALHKRTSQLVNASAQSKMMRGLQEQLTEEERGIFKKGRNTKSVSTAKNQSVTDYRRATGFEALVGYLYLKEDWERLLFLIEEGLRILEEGEGNER